MAKHFLKMKEIMSAEDILNAKPATIIQVEVNGKADAVSKKPQFLQFFSGKQHKDTHHICHHKTGVPCEIEEI